MTVFVVQEVVGKNILSAEISKVQKQERKQALQQLIQYGKVMSIEDDDVLRGLVNAKVLSKSANEILKKAHKSVRHTAKKIKAFRIQKHINSK